MSGLLRPDYNARTHTGDADMPMPSKADLYLWKPVLAEYNYCCAGCGSTLDIEYDHVIPQCKGGRDSVDNMQILCHHCNNRKNKTDGLPKLAPRLPEDSCTIIKKNREVFLMWLKSMRKSNIASKRRAH